MISLEYEGSYDRVAALDCRTSARPRGIRARPDSELKVDTTICDEIRDNGRMVVFDNAEDNTEFHDHHTPRIYGLKSYISVPIYRRSTEFFGTLCAIDANPAKVNTHEIVAMFQLFAELIGKHIDAREYEEEADAQLLLEREVAVFRDRSSRSWGTTCAIRSTPSRWERAC